MTALCSARPWFRETADISHLEELSRRLLEAEAAGHAADPLAELARNVVTQAQYSSCCCCGRLLTDPVSVKTGIGPECGETFHKMFLAQWRVARAAVLEAH